ncbi:DNA mismatch repair endonuclease MutH [Veronia pacifica]|uniref:DNA mismatch repair protein MutH n=1 Tax=Veronia pacifica TaxID=1080227 RepID=A0A1C3EK85_9GAMM|nr:DNA mismatch repair endonuclease MutH [Veronia pacifica]ODA33640.1 DNA mismatch repair endonuclease MutH [Veronia pacifica]
MNAAPQTEQELLERALELAGFSLGEIAAKLGQQCPMDLKREKGWVGMLLETWLGATAGSKPVQDFEDLAIELKSIPISYSGKPLETTFVCVAPLTGIHGLSWEKSHIRQKLSKVLWIPVEGERDIPVCDRQIGMPLLWQPSTEEEAQLKADWEELMDMIALGEIAKINARHGEYLQLRPKGMNGKVVTEAYGASGQPIKAQPKGFYLRKSFTERILRRHFLHLAENNQDR